MGIRQRMIGSDYVSMLDFEVDIIHWDIRIIIHTNVFRMLWMAICKELQSLFSIDNTNHSRDILRFYTSIWLNRL